MHETKAFALESSPDQGEERASRLLREGKPTGAVVPGRVLEAQYAHGRETLLFVTHDIPFEEQLDILLLDAASRLVDRVSLFGAYTTGSFRDPAIVGPDAVRFDFFGERPWLARVLAQPRLRWPLGDPPGTRRPPSLRKRLELRHTDRPGKDTPCSP